jgi:acetyl esterase/lipase
MDVRATTAAVVYFGLIALLWPASLAAQQPGSLSSIERVGRWSPSEIEAEGERLFQWYGVPDAQYPVDEYIVHYYTRDFNGALVEVKSQLYVPVMQRSQERPVLLFGSGTTGIADKCAPSLEQPDKVRWGYYRTNMASYAGQGFITIFPDYVGFNDPRRAQRYFSKLAEAHVLLDGYRAVRNFFESYDGAVAPANHAFTAGYSQGGHAALASADIVRDYAPDVPLRGAIGFAATNNVTTLLQEAAYYAPYIFYAYRAMYGNEIDPESYLKPRFARTLEQDIQQKCVKEMEVYYPFDGRELYTERFYNALHNGNLQREYPALYRRLEDNLAGLSGHDIPALLVQGTHDIIITPPAKKAYVSRLCDTGVPVQYREYGDARHRHTRPAGFRASIEWMEHLAAGRRPPNDCGGF